MGPVLNTAAKYSAQLIKVLRLKTKKPFFIGWHIVSLLFDRISWNFKKIISQSFDRTRTTP
jgi:hypothetical protein